MPASFDEISIGQVVNLGAVAGYIAKGASTGVLRALGIHRRGEGGVIIGKRWGRSGRLA